MNINGLEMNLKLTRHEICDLLIAIVEAEYSCNNPGSNKWTRLHSKIKEQLDQFDDNWKSCIYDND